MPEEIKKRKITILYEGCAYIGDNGLETIEGWIQSNTYEQDGSRTILIRTEPTHSHPKCKEEIEKL